MKRTLLLALSLTSMLLSGCATPAGETLSARREVVPVPRTSVAAERCLESYRVRSSTQGAFFREVIC